jgi:putative phosphoribosyl transferase
MARAPLYRDRHDAGRRLAKAMKAYAGEEALVLALPRGGVPVAYEVAKELHGELDVLVARKLGVPGHEELAFGAIAGDEKVLDEGTIAGLGISADDIARVETAERAEADRRMAAYRAGRGPPRIAGRTVILVDDGVATGSTARAALRSLRKQSPARLVFAAPVGPVEASRALRAEADDVVIAHTPPLFGAVGPWYEDFGQTSDDDVLALLRAPSGRALDTTPIGGHR